MSTVCRVPWCAALVVGTAHYCREHEHAALARDVSAAGRNCVRCHRLIGKESWVEKSQVVQTRRKPGGEVYGWRHVICVSKVRKSTRRAVRLSEKPLFKEL